MSIFGDIADSIGGAVDWVKDAAGTVEHGISDVVHSGLVKGGLDLAGGFFGDASLGDQIAGGFSVLDKVFGKGSGAAAVVRKAVRPTRATRPAARGRGRVAASPLVTVRTKSGRVIRLTRDQFAALKARMMMRPPVVIPPPRPPPQLPQPLIPVQARALLNNAEAVAAAVAAGGTIQVGGKLIDTTKPIGLPPAQRDLANAIQDATGLQVLTGSPRTIDLVPRSGSADL